MALVSGRYIHPVLHPPDSPARLIQSLNSSNRPIRPVSTSNDKTLAGAIRRSRQPGLESVPDDGFEPTKAEPADLQSAPFGRSGNLAAVLSTATIVTVHVTQCLAPLDGALVTLL